MQPQGRMPVVVGIVDDDPGPRPVLDRPRFCLQPVDGAESRVHPEAGLPSSTASGLRAKGHPVLAGVAPCDRALFGRGQVIPRDAAGTLTGGGLFYPREDAELDGGDRGD